MDDVVITPKMLRGSVVIPPSKSVAHRAIIAAALSGGECIIDNLTMSDDILATLEGMRALGSKYTMNKKDKRVCISSKKGGRKSTDLEIDCAESGSTLRFLIPVALVYGGNIKFTGHGRLMQRPQKPYIDMFKKKGIKCESSNDYLSFSGQLKGGRYEITGDISSQFITGLLMALPLLEEDSEIIVTTSPESKGYIDISLDVLREFGIEIENYDYKKYIIKGGQKYKPRNYTVEGDYSQAAFFLVAGALGCDITCLGLSEKSSQGDRAIVKIIEQAGGKIEKKNGGISAVVSENMCGITVDVRDIPDLVPILAVLFAFCRGESKIVGAGRLRMKESDRLAAISKELTQLGVDITEGSDSLVINGCQVAECGVVSSWGDHRIAMALSIAACRCEGEAVTITGASAVRKSYPDFFEVYKSLDGDIKG